MSFAPYKDTLQGELRAVLTVRAYIRRNPRLPPETSRVLKKLVRQTNRLRALKRWNKKRRNKHK